MNIDNFYNTNNKFKYSIINVGSGLMILIINSNSDVLLFDCNISDENMNTILDYLEEIIPSRWSSEKEEYSQWIDIFVNSHRDLDHIRGLKALNEKFAIKEIWDSGQSGATCNSSDYQYYMRLRRSLKNKYGNNSVKIPMPSLIPIYNRNNLKIHCLNSVLEYSENNSYCTSTDLQKQLEEGLIDEDRVKKQHTNSIVLTFESNGFRLLLCGDSDWLSWRDKIVPIFETTNLLDSDVLVASHHGSRSFFTSEENEHIDIEINPDTTYLKALEYISPHMTLISCGAYREYHHPNPEALRLYKKKTSNNQVYTTYARGTFEGYANNQNDWAVVPCIFKSAYPNKFEIVAKVNNSVVRNGVPIPKNSLIQFFVRPVEHGFLEPFRNLQIKWSVCNSAKNENRSHHEIYDNNENEANKLTFSRDLAYSGQHLLRCYINNPSKGKSAIQIFKVISDI